MSLGGCLFEVRIEISCLFCSSCMHKVCIVNVSRSGIVSHSLMIDIPRGVLYYCAASRTLLISSPFLLLFFILSESSSICSAFALASNKTPSTTSDVLYHVEVCLCFLCLYGCILFMTKLNRTDILVMPILSCLDWS